MPSRPLAGEIAGKQFYLCYWMNPDCHYYKVPDVERLVDIEVLREELAELIRLISFNDINLPNS